MASREGSKSSVNEGTSSVSLSYSATTTTGTDSSDEFTKSCPPILEPSKRPLPSFEGTLDSPLSCPSPNMEISVISSTESSVHEDQQRKSSEHRTSNEQKTDQPAEPATAPTKTDDSTGITKSCPPVLEPSKDELHLSDAARKRPFLTSSCPTPSTQEMPITSSTESSVHEEQPLLSNEQQTDQRQTICCLDCMNCCPKCVDGYFNLARKIGDSCFIHIFQFLVVLLCASAIVMGIIYFKSCVGDYPSAEPLAAIIMGISGLVLVYLWLSKVCRQRRGDYYWNFEKTRLVICFSVVLFVMALEFFFFLGMSPHALLLNKKDECPEAYYDYLYYMHIVDAGCLLLAALLYLPDCCIHLFAFRIMERSQANGHYQPL